MSHELKAPDATMAGQAARISAAQKAQLALKAGEAELKAEITITRAGTGKVEHYTLTAIPQPKEA